MKKLNLEEFAIGFPILEEKKTKIINFFLIFEGNVNLRFRATENPYINLSDIKRSLSAISFQNQSFLLFSDKKEPFYKQKSFLHFENKMKEDFEFAQKEILTFSQWKKSLSKIFCEQAISLPELSDKKVTFEEIVLKNLFLHKNSSRQRTDEIKEVFKIFLDLLMSTHLDVPDMKVEPELEPESINRSFDSYFLELKNLQQYFQKETFSSVPRDTLLEQMSQLSLDLEKCEELGYSNVPSSFEKALAFYEKKIYQFIQVDQKHLVEKPKFSLVNEENFFHFLRLAGENCQRMKKVKSTQLKIIYTLLFYGDKMKLIDISYLTHQNLIELIQKKETSIERFSVKKKGFCVHRIKANELLVEKLLELEKSIAFLFSEMNFQFLGSTSKGEKKMGNYRLLIKLVSADMNFTNRLLGLGFRFSNMSFRQKV